MDKKRYSMFTKVAVTSALVATAIVPSAISGDIVKVKASTNVFDSNQAQISIAKGYYLFTPVVIDGVSGLEIKVNTGAGKDYQGPLHIPKEHNGDKVISVGEAGFQFSKASAIIFEDTSQIINIGKSAFASATSATNEVDFPNITRVNDNAFELSGFSSITFGTGEQVTRIDLAAFSGSKATNNIYLPNVTTIGQRAFANSNFETIDFNGASELTSIQYHTFIGAKATNEIRFSSIKAMAEGAFRRSNFKSIVLVNPELITSIGLHTFSESEATNPIDLPNIKSIPTGAFEGSNFESITFGPLGGDIFSLGIGAFRDSKATNTLTLSGIKNVSRNAFKNSGFKQVYLSGPGTITYDTEAIIPNPPDIWIQGSTLKLSEFQFEPKTVKVVRGNKANPPSNARFINSKDTINSYTRELELPENLKGVDLVVGIQYPSSSNYVLHYITTSSNMPPKIDDILLTVLNEGDWFNTPISAVDPEGEEVTFSFINHNPDIVTAEMFLGNLKFNGIKKGTGSVTIIATDASGAQTSKKVDLEVLAPAVKHAGVATVLEPFTIEDTGVIDLSRTLESDLKVIDNSTSSSVIYKNGKISISPARKPFGYFKIVLEGKNSLGLIEKQTIQLNVQKAKPYDIGEKVIGSTFKYKPTVGTNIYTKGSLKSVSTNIAAVWDEDTDEVSVTVNSLGDSKFTFNGTDSVGHPVQQEIAFKAVDKLTAPQEELPGIEGGGTGTFDPPNISGITPPFTDVTLTVDKPEIADAVWEDSTQKIKVTGKPGMSGKVTITFKGNDSAGTPVTKDYIVEIVALPVDTEITEPIEGETELSPTDPSASWTNVSVTIDEPTKADVRWDNVKNKIILTPKPGATGTAKVTFKGTNSSGVTVTEIFTVTFKDSPLPPITAPPVVIEGEGSGDISPVTPGLTDVTLTVDKPDIAEATWDQGLQKITVRGKAGKSGVVTITLKGKNSLNQEVTEVYTVTIKASPTGGGDGGSGNIKVESGNDVELTPPGVAPYTNSNVTSSNESVATATLEGSKIKVTTLPTADGTTDITFTADDANGDPVNKTWTVEARPVPIDPSVPNAPTSTDTTLEVESGELSLEHVKNSTLALQLDLDSKREEYKMDFLDELNVEDARGTLEGWNLTVEASRFTEKDIDGTYAGDTQHMLASGTLLLTSPTVSNMTGNLLPTTGVTGLSTKSAIDNNSPILVGTASQGHGGGVHQFKFQDGLSIIVDPSDIRINTKDGNKTAVYTTTLNWTLSSGPTN